MPRRSFRGRPRVSRPRRKLVWARFAAINLTVAGNPVAEATATPVVLDALLPFEQSLGASTIGVTVVRTRGVISFGPSAAEPIQLRATLHVDDNADFGTEVDGDDNAFSTVSQNRDYFMFEPFVAYPTETPNTSDVTRRLIDVKSSRKVEELNQTVKFTLSGITETATDISIAQVDLSLLLMLP